MSGHFEDLSGEESGESIERPSAGDILGADYNEAVFWDAENLTDSYEKNSALFEWLFFGMDKLLMQRGLEVNDPHMRVLQNFSEKISQGTSVVEKIRGIKRARAYLLEDGFTEDELSAVNLLRIAIDPALGEISPSNMDKKFRDIAENRDIRNEFKKFEESRHNREKN